jgi:hypothetical protein
MKKNPLNIILILLVSIFIVLVVLFIRQIVSRPKYSAKLDAGTSNVITSSVIPSPATNPTLTTNATLSGQTQTDIDPNLTTIISAAPVEISKGGLVEVTPTPIPTPKPTPKPTPAPVKTITKEETVTVVTNRPSTHPYLAGCGEYNKDNNTFQAIVKLPKMDNKNAMTAQVGSSLEKNDLYEGSFEAASEQTIRVTVNNNTNYYVRYRFDNGDWSNSLEFSCVRK